MHILEAEFRAFVSRHFVNKATGPDGYMHAAAGLAGESGEVLDLIKKHWVYNKPLDREKLLEEMGDVHHYFTQLCLITGFTLEDVIANNTAKLIKRYPEGYTDAAAIARADQQ